MSNRIYWSLFVLFGSFVGLLSVAIPNSDLWQAKFQHLVIMLVVLLNVGVNILQVKVCTRTVASVTYILIFGRMLGEKVQF